MDGTFKKRSVPFEVIFEGNYADLKIIAVNKMSGLSVGGDRWDMSKERLDKMIASALGIKQIFTVHRIDRETSGIVVFAMDRETHRRLSMAFENQEIKKRYFAAVSGQPLWKETVCDLPLVPNGNKLHQTIIDKYRGKKSLTHFKLLGSAGNYSIIEAIPETGRTHQIRVHLASMGHPVVCDEIYGNNKAVFLSAIKRKWRGDPLTELPLLSRLGLHAAELILPPQGENTLIDPLVLKAPLPRDMTALFKQMEKAGHFEINLS